MQGLRQRVFGLRGWRRHGLALLLGGLAALALPPLYLVPLLVPAFAGLVWLIDGASRPRAAFAAGWWFGLGHFAVGLYWIAIAFVTDIRYPAWPGPFAVFGLAAVEALFPALAAWAVARIPRSGVARVVLLACAWTAGEWLRARAFTGFPWNQTGSVWAFSDSMLQGAALAGTYGLGLLTVLAAAMPAVWGTHPRGRAATLAGVALLGLLFAGGTWRLAAAPPADVDGVRLRLVQPDIPQQLKWRRDLRGRHVATQLEMSRRPADGPPPTHVIWAETMVPFLLDRSPEVLKALGDVAPQGGVAIVGAPRAEGSGADYRVWNSLLAVDPEGRVRGTYDKSHLVPFGEYVPFRKLLPIAKLTAGATDFSPGPGRTVLDLPGLPPVSPLICYEVIFPGEVVPDGRRPGWILNLTNDAWYGRSTGPYQHFVTARLRAVEEGLPVVRVAQGGISGVVDGLGRVRASLGLGRKGVLDAPLPAAEAGLTPYARFGDAVAGVLILAFAAFAILLGGKTIRNTS